MPSSLSPVTTTRARTISGTATAKFHFDYYGLPHQLMHKLGGTPHGDDAPTAVVFEYADQATRRFDVGDGDEFVCTTAERVDPDADPMGWRVVWEFTLTVRATTDVADAFERLFAADDPDATLTWIAVERDPDGPDDYAPRTAVAADEGFTDVTVAGP